MNTNNFAHSTSNANSSADSYIPNVTANAKYENYIDDLVEMTTGMSIEDFNALCPEDESQ